MTYKDLKEYVNLNLNVPDETPVNVVIDEGNGYMSIPLFAIRLDKEGKNAPVKSISLISRNIQNSNCNFIN